MVKKQQSKRQRNIKSKLMAAICMLLVSTIMMVSSTYAWFTLSTAPEVTGITTAVGANGNLEMALLPKSGDVNDITSTAGDSMAATEAKNVTWGNLVDLKDSTIYGLDKITLFPAALNLLDSDKDANGNPTSLQSTLLSTPEYGADGRVSILSPNTSTAYFNSTDSKFYPNDDYGVRAVGSASGMTDRQLDYKNAQSAANSATAFAKNLASQSLNTNGSALANIAIEYGMGADTASFNKTDVAALRKIINDLNGDEGVLDQIEKAYMQYILAYAASAAGGDDIAWKAVQGAVSEEDATLDSVKALLGSLPSGLNDALTQYDDMVEAVTEADTALAALETTLFTNADATFTWEQIKTAMEHLAKPAAMKVNGILASDVKDNLGKLVSSVTSQGGLKVIMESGAGVYADIADQCGDFNASVTIEQVEYNGIVLNNMTARMETDSNKDPNFWLVAIGTAVKGAGAPADGATGTMPITDMYGYIIDLAFRTNAAESDLMLQVEPKDRIYSDNTNDATMGGGSSMTFKATTTDFTDTQVKELMSAIRIIFFNPTSKAVIATAKLDAANAELEAEGWKADMYLYKKTGGETTYTEANYASDGAGGYRTAEDSDTELYALIGSEYKKATHVVLDTDAGTYQPAGDGVKATHVEVVATTGETLQGNKIMSLTQNTAAPLSVLVYLDGDKVGNGQVAATAATSMTGSMNLQFSSSATLVPMEYAELHQGSGSGNNQQPTTTTLTAVTKAGSATAVTITSSVYDGSNIKIQLNGWTNEAVTITVGDGGTAQTVTPDSNGLITYAVADVTATTPVTVTIGA